MLHHIHLPLVPITWSQTLAHEGATTLRARLKCEPHAELKLRNDAKLTQYEIELTILNGEVTAEDHIKYKLVHEAIGGLWLVDDKDVAAFVYGWFFINTNVYDDLWEQVRQGGYAGCSFSLDVGPVEDDQRWSGGPLSILGASISFDRTPPIDDASQRPARKGWFGR